MMMNLQIQSINGLIYKIFNFGFHLLELFLALVYLKSNSDSYG
jgi:hypothetical protein